MSADSYLTLPYSCTCTFREGKQYIEVPKVRYGRYMKRRRKKKKKKKAAARRVVEPRDAKDTCSGRSCECARSLWLDERENERERMRNRRIAKTSLFFSFSVLCLLTFVHASKA